MKSTRTKSIGIAMIFAILIPIFSPLTNIIPDQLNVIQNIDNISEENLEEIIDLPENSLPVMEGSYGVDIDYSYQLTISGSSYMSAPINYDAEVNIAGGSETRGYDYSESQRINNLRDAYTEGGTFTLTPSHNVDFDLHITSYPADPLHSQFNFELNPESNLYASGVDHKSDSWFFHRSHYTYWYDITFTAVTYPIAKVYENSFTINKISASSGESYDLFFSIQNPTISSSVTTDVTLERSLDNGVSWEEISLGTVTLSSGESRDFNYGDSTSTPESDFRVKYRIRLQNEHFQYLSYSKDIMINPLKPFISRFSVFLEKEFNDFGIMNPTEVIRVEGRITNPTGVDVNDLTIVFNRYFSDDVRDFELVTLDIPTLGASQTLDFSMEVADINQLTQSDWPFLIPGKDLWIDEDPLNVIDLEDWMWCAFYDTWEIYSLVREVTFNIWIQNEDSKVSLEQAIYISRLKIGYARTITESYRILDEYFPIQVIIENIELGIWAIEGGLLVVSALTLENPVLLALEGLLFVIAGIFHFSNRHASEIIDEATKNIIENLVNIVIDPPDPNIYEIIEIEYETIDPLDDTVKDDERFIKLHELLSIQNELEDVTRAIKITNDRYMYAMTHGEYVAAELQATAFEEFTILQTNLYYSYTSRLEGIFDDFTLYEIVTDIGYDFNQFADNYTEVKEIFLDNIDNIEVRQILIDEGYTDEDIEQMISIVDDFDIYSINQELEYAFGEFNSEAEIVANNAPEIIDELFSGAEELVLVAQNPDSETKYTTTSNQYDEIMKIEVAPSVQEVVNNGSVVYTLEIQNLLEEPAIYDIEIANIDRIDFSYTSEIEVDPRDIVGISIIVKVPNDMEPIVINPLISVSKEINGRLYEKTKSIVLKVKDDDISPPILSNLNIAVDINEIYVSFVAEDDSGIDNISIFIDGEIMDPIYQFQDGNLYSFTLLNQWRFKQGSYDVEMRVTDADNDRPNDNLINSIYGNFEISLGNMYEYVVWQIEELKAYIDENFSCRKSRCLNWKLSKAEEYLAEAFSLVENGEITCALYHDKIAKVLVQISESRIDIYNRHCCISDEHTEHTINTLRTIRNNIVVLMGASTGSERAFVIAYVEVDLLNLSDFIEDEVPSCTGKYLNRKVYWASKMLEIAIFKISMDKDIECLLNFAQWKLERVICKVNWYLEKDRISEDLANYLIDEITRIIETIGQVS